LDIYLKRNQTTLFLNHYQNSVGINYAPKELQVKIDTSYGYTNEYDETTDG